jgi:hypothetical protein
MAEERVQEPSSPTELTKPSWAYVAKRTVREFQADGGQDLAAALTFYALLAAAPATVALVSLLGFVGNPQKAIDDTLNTLKTSRRPRRSTRSSRSSNRSPGARGRAGRSSSASRWRCGRRLASSVRSDVP